MSIFIELMKLEHLCSTSVQTDYSTVIPLLNCLVFKKYMQ